MKYNVDMKKNLILVVFVLALIIFTIFVLPKIQNGKQDSYVLPEPLTLCYLQDLNYPEGRDYAFMKVNLLPDRSVNGDLEVSLLNEESYAGVFAGKWSRQNGSFILNFIHDYKKSATSGKEQKLLRLENQHAYLGMGTMIQNKDIFEYKNIKNLTYIDMFLEVSCADNMPTQ